MEHPVTTLRELRRLSRSQRGAVVVESALILPVFLIVIFATMEFGLAFRTYLTMSSAARDSVRHAATLGRDPEADFQVLYEAMHTLDVVGGGNVSKIVIFKATGPDSTTGSGALAACRTASVTNLCNTYSGTGLQANPADFGCGPTALDRFWCPSNRKVAVSDPPDYVGIYIEVDHQGITGVIGMTRTFSDEIVMRLEPVRT